MKKKKTLISRLSASFAKLNRPKTIRYLILLAFILIGTIVYKKLFFIVFFIFSNWFILYLLMGYGIKSPVEIITFGTFMCGYVYGPVEGLIVSGSSLVSIAITGRISFDKIIINLILFFIAGIAQYLRVFNVVIAGILALLIRYVLDFVINFIILRDDRFITKIPQRVINLLFWVFVYTSMGQLVSSLMEV